MLIAPLDKRIQQRNLIFPLDDSLHQLAPVTFFDLTSFGFDSPPRSIFFISASTGAVTAEHSILPADILECSFREGFPTGQSIVLILHGCGSSAVGFIDDGNSPLKTRGSAALHILRGIGWRSISRNASSIQHFSQI